MNWSCIVLILLHHLEEIHFNADGPFPHSESHLEETSDTIPSQCFPNMGIPFPPSLRWDYSGPTLLCVVMSLATHSAHVLSVCIVFKKQASWMLCAPEEQKGQWQQPPSSQHWPPPLLASYLPRLPCISKCYFGETFWLLCDRALAPRTQVYLTPELETTSSIFATLTFATAHL